MITSFLRALLLLPFVLLAGCCANTACNCNDLLADSLYFRFDTSQFRANDIDTVYLFRYSSASATKANDSVQLTRRQTTININKLLASQSLPTGTNPDSSLIILSNNAPFSPATTGGKLSQYTYVLLVPKGDSLRLAPGSTQPRKVYSYRIGPTTIKGQYQADGCCTCYQNTQKTTAINGTVFDATETGTNGQGGHPVPFLLRK